MTKLSPSTSWSSDITASTYDVVIQCTKGIVFVNWAGSAPADTTDGFILGMGDSIVLPAGSTFRVAMASWVDEAKVFYEEFPA